MYTIQRKGKVLELLLELKIKNIKDMNQTMINKFLELISDKTDETKIRNIKNLKAFLNYCMGLGLYDYNMYKVLKFPILKGKTRDTVVTDADYQKLVDNTNDEDFKLYVMTL